MCRDEWCGEGVKVVHVVERQKLAQVRALQEAAKVVGLGEEEEHVERVVRVRREPR